MPFRRSLIALTLVVAVFLSAAGPASASTSRWRIRHRMFTLVNGSRHTHGVRPLRLNEPLSSYAWRHSVRMATERTVFHATNVWGEVSRYGAATWGENVGMAGTLRQLERLFMRSPSHRANILASRFHRIGVGVSRAHGAVWVTLDFYGG